MHYALLLQDKLIFLAFNCVISNVPRHTLYQLLDTLIPINVFHCINVFI